MNINIPGIDTDKAIKNAGSPELFTELLGDVYKLIDEKSNQVEAHLAQKDIKNYIIDVHSLKTTCRMIGAAELGERFFTLEKLGKENDLEQIERLTPDVLSSFRSLKPYLEPYAVRKCSDKKAFEKAGVSALLTQLISAIDDFNLGTAEDITKQLFSYDCNKEMSVKLETLEKNVSNLDYDEAKVLAKEILSSL